MEIDITLFGPAAGKAALAAKLARFLKQEAAGSHLVIASCNYLPARDGSRQPTVDYSIEHMGKL